MELGLVEGIDRGPAGNAMTDCVGACVCLFDKWRGRGVDQRSSGQVDECSPPL